MKYFTLLLITSFLFAGGVLMPGCERSPQSSPATTPASAHSHAETGETCFICDASKRDADRLWCREHDRYEDRCWLCHPELEDESRLYCNEHGLYEDECFLCHPEILGAAGNDAAATTVSSNLFCTEHGVAEINCAICRADQIDRLSPGDELLIRFSSNMAMTKAGIEFVDADLATMAPTVRALAEVTFNQNKTARITPLTSGIVTEVLVDVGEHVRTGDALVRIHSAEVAGAKGALLTANVEVELREQSFERESSLLARNITSRQDFEAALAALQRTRIDATNARQRLINLGLSEDELARIEAEQDSSATLTIRSPFNGDVVMRDASVGEMASPGEPLMMVSDRSTVWIELSVPASELARITTGATVSVRLDSLPDDVVEATLVWIDARVDPRSRMIRARAVASNPDGKLREGLYGEGRIAAAATSQVTRVPVTAVQLIGEATFVFVSSGPDLLAARRVAVASKSDQWIDIDAGLSPGERVVATGSFTALSEMLKARLGAGCVHE